MPGDSLKEAQLVGFTSTGDVIGVFTSLEFR
jgi:hypothetical protein